MSDVFTKRKRSEVMSRIRGRGNRDTELVLAKLLRKYGIKGWRRQQKLKIERRKRRAGRKGVGGHRRAATAIGIDFLFPKERVAVFVDGCFWHGCPKHSPPHRWIAKSSMRAGKLSAVSDQQSTRRGKREEHNQSSVVREECTNSYQTEEARQRSFDKLRMTAEGKRTGPPSLKLRRTGKSFWREKMAANIARDRFVNLELRKRGWKVVRVWEHELVEGGRRRAKGGKPKRVLQRIRKALRPGKIVHGLHG